MLCLILIASGALTALTYAFSSISLFCWISLIPYFYIIYEKSYSGVKKKKLYGYGFVFSLSYFCVLFHWFAYQYPMEYMGFSQGESFLYILLCIIGLSLLYSLSLALIPPVFSLLSKTYSVHKYYFIKPFIIPSLWAICEWLQSKTWLGVPWGKLALTQYKNLTILQPISVFGSYFISFLIVLTNALLAYFIFTTVKEKSYRGIPLYICIAVLLSNYIFGAYLFQKDVNHENQIEETVSVSVLQGNIDSNQKWHKGAYYTISKAYNELLLHEADNFPDIIIYPESAYPYELSDYDIRCFFSSFSNEHNVILLLGCFANEDGNPKNSIAVFYPKNYDAKYISDKLYSKRRLVPFGEYLPMKSFIEFALPMLADINLYSSELTPGVATAITRTEKGNIGSLICFDSIYELLSRESVLAGANMLAVSTNDSWFKDSAAVYEHNAHSVLRSIEFRRYVARAANTGISSIISARGEIIDSLPPLVCGSLNSDIKMREDLTFYAKHGNFFIAICHIFIYFLVINTFWHKYRSKRASVIDFDCQK